VTNKKKEFKLFLIAICLMLLDQISKYLVIKFRLFTIYFNPGVSFGILLSPVWVWLNLAIIAVVGYFLIKKPSLGLGLILAGGISNFIDRIAYGGVVDWVKLARVPWSNNLADIWISMGVVLMLINLARYYRINNLLL